MHASKSASSLTIVITAEVEVKIFASFPGMAITTGQKKSPTKREYSNDTMVANFVPFAFPAPSSFATRTLDKEVKPYYQARRGKLDESTVYSLPR